MTAAIFMLIITALLWIFFMCWSKSPDYNLVVKFLLLIMALWGSYETLRAFGLIIAIPGAVQ